MNEPTAIRILYMEDDRAQARIVQKTLRRSGYHVDLASDGEEGLAMCSTGSYDLLVVDQSMPGREGLDVIRTLVSRDPLPPTIMVTGTGDERTAVDAMKLGVSDYVVKSMTGGFVKYLPVAIGRALEEKRLAQEKQQVEEELRDSEAKFRGLYESTSDAVMLLDDQSFLDCNEATLKVFGCSGREEFLAKHPSELSPPTQPDGQDSRSAADARIAVAFRDGSNRFEWMHRRVDGTDFPAEVLLNAMVLNGRGVLQAVVRDISNRKRMEAELVQAQKLESIGQLAAGIAHEINTPSQYIGDNTRFLQGAFEDIDRLLGHFDRLLQAAKGGRPSDELAAEVEAAVEEADLEYLTEEIPKAIRQSQEGVNRVATIVRAMKEFSHPGGEQKQAIDLNQAIENTVTVSRNEWKYVADLTTDFDPMLPPVCCHPSEINQVILNVIVNAAQAIGEVAGESPQRKGAITIRSRRDADFAEIRITDTGPGIPKEVRPKVFDHFFTTKEVGKGTGQGLTIAHSIVVEKHRGTITFETETGQGTTFVIRLPLHEEPSPRKGTSNEEAHPVCG